jgi:hypothetical protein
MENETEIAELTITIPSILQGERIWRRVGERDHVTRDGRAMVLAVWETPCAVCREPFQIATPPHYISAEHSKVFEAATCPRHRMTPTEMNKLRRVTGEDRRSLFEEIRKAKLADA